MFYNRIVRAFTLIEVLTVIAVLGILATLSIGPIRAAQQRSRDNLRKSDINLIAQALDLYYSENRTLPGTGLTCVYKSTDKSPWIPGLSSRYLPSSNGKVLPVDPRKGDSTLYYTYTNLLCEKQKNPALNLQGQTFKLQAVMENKKDGDSTVTEGTAIYEVVR